MDHHRLNEKARIVNVSSIAHARGTSIDPDNLFANENNYVPMKSYQHSKIANVLFTKELQRRFNKISEDGMDTCSLHPGVVATELARYITDRGTLGYVTKIFFPIVQNLFKTPLQGAQTNISCAIDPHLVKGAYYSDCVVKEPTLPPSPEEVAKRLWKKSEEICNYKCKSLSE